jgi:hypothetical protein
MTAALRELTPGIHELVGTRVYQTPSRTHPHVDHLITEHNGAWHCTCPATSQRTGDQPMTQSILRADRIIDHPVPTRYFKRLQAWWNLRQAGAGARNLDSVELQSLRAERSKRPCR